MNLETPNPKLQTPNLERVGLGFRVSLLAGTSSLNP